MPVKIAENLPARKILEKENIFVMTEKRALSQDIRPLKLLILNLMPLKTSTETSLLRRLSNTPLQIEVDFLRTATYTSKNTSFEYLNQFYKTFSEIESNIYDGLIVTGAPVENLAFEEVDYWDELCEIFKWAQKRVFASLYLCWGAQAALYHHYNIEKYRLEKKVFGVFEHQVTSENAPLLRGFDPNFFAPHSRYTETRKEDVEQIDELHVLAESREAGLYAVASEDGRRVFIFGHPEYERETLHQEYQRDKAKNIEIERPKNYYKEDNPALDAEVRWYSHAQLLYSNWLNYYVYQTTPYDLQLLPSKQKARWDKFTLT